jgi:galactokinase
MLAQLLRCNAGVVVLNSNLKTPEAVRQLFKARFGADASNLLSVPGRINLIGEHIDYHDLPVLPMAIQRHIDIAFEGSSRPDIRVESVGYEPRQSYLQFVRNPRFPAGDWGNYVNAATQLAATYWPIERGIQAAIESNLPPAAGLSSSSALLMGLTLALLAANGIRPSFDELMKIFPEGEQLVGTRGGGMDHAAILGARAGTALLIRFAPLIVEPVPIPEDWTFIAAHSLTMAEKSGAARLEFNSRREAGISALKKTGFPSFRAALAQHSASELDALARRSGLSDIEQGCFRHVTSEAERVERAIRAISEGDLRNFGQLLSAAHASLRDQLRVSNRSIDELVDCAIESGAAGARMTGGGFGGYVIALCRKSERERLRSELIQRFYCQRPGLCLETHLFFAEPSAGVLFA